MPKKQATYRIVKYRDAAGEHRFRIVAANGRIVADGGEGYKSYNGRDKAIDRLVRFLSAGLYTVVDEATPR